MWLRRSLSTSFRTSKLNTALGAGTIVEPGELAWLPRGSKGPRANKGRKSNTPATRVRRRRPGARLTARTSATTVGSGAAGGGAGGGRWGRPSGGGTKQGGPRQRALGHETDRPSSVTRSPESQTAGRYRAGNALQCSRHVALRTGGER